MKESTGTLFTAIVLAIITVVGAKCPEDPRGATRKYQGYCYEFIKEKTYYPQAQAKCRQHSGHLITIESKEKQAWLAKTISDDLLWVDKSSVSSGCNIWIGINRDEASLDPSTGYQLWYEDNGKSDAQAEMVPLKFTNWYSPDEPDVDKNRNCAALGYGTNFQWIASRCTNFPSGFYVVCQYDGPDGFLSNPALSIPVIVLMSLLVIAGSVLLYKCYIKRRALEQRLHNEKYDENIFTDYQINSTDDDDMNEDNTKLPIDNNNAAPQPYAPVYNLTPAGNSYHDFNIQTDPGYCQDKLQHKDLSLKDVSSNSSCEPPNYSRSVSAPPNCGPTYPSAPSETCSIVMEEDEHISNLDERAPLHLQRTDSIESNRLSA